MLSCIPMKKASVVKLLLITPKTADRQQYTSLLSASTRYTFNTQFVATIQETQGQLEKFCPHCIVMDVKLDTEEATIFLQDLKRSKAYRRFPIIWITAVNEARLIPKAIKLGVQDVADGLVPPVPCVVVGVPTIETFFKLTGSVSLKGKFTTVPPNVAPDGVLLVISN